MLKFCLISPGMMIGMAVGTVFFGALGVFAAAYVPLMGRFYRVFKSEKWGGRTPFGSLILPPDSVW